MRLLLAIVLLMVTAGLNVTENTSNATFKPFVNLSSNLVFPNQTLTICANFKPSHALIQNPAGKFFKLKFTRSGELYVSKLKFEKDVVLGEYTVMVDGIVKHFVVDFYLINATFNGSFVVGNVKYYYLPPKTLNYTIDDLQGFVELNKGRFEIPIPIGNHTITLQCGNAKVVLKVERRGEIHVRDFYFLNDTVFINSTFRPLRAYVVTPSNERINLNFEKVKNVYSAKFIANEIGVYRVYADGLVENFTVDDYVISAKVVNSTVMGTVKWHYLKPKTLIYIFEPSNVKGRVNVVNGRFKVPIPKNATKVVLKCGNAVLTLPISKLNIDVVREDLGYLEFKTLLNGREVKANVSATLNGRILKVRLFNGSYVLNYKPENGLLKVTAEYDGFKARLKRVINLKINSHIELKGFRVFVYGNVTFNGRPVNAKVEAKLGKVIEVSHGEFNFTFNASSGKILKIEASYRNLTVLRVYRINSSPLNFDVKVGRRVWINGSSTIPCEYSIDRFKGVVKGKFNLSFNLLSGNYTIKFLCGNLSYTRNFSIKKDIYVKSLYFPNETVEVFANFKPSKAFIKNPVGELHNLKFKFEGNEYVSRFELKRRVILGNYTVTVDGIVRRFVVDCYNITARFNGSAVIGNVSWHFVPPKYVEYRVEPTNLRGYASVMKGKFVVFVPENSKRVVLKCGNAVLSLPIERFERKVSDFKVVNVSVDGKVYRLNVTLDRGKFGELRFDKGSVSLKIINIPIGGNVNVTVKLPFRIPNGMHIYYWKTVNGSVKPVEYFFSKDRREITFVLKDGLIDEDGKANGVIVDPIVFYIPRFNVESELDGNSGILHVYDLNGGKLYDVKVEVDKGNLTYLAFVDSANLPKLPTKFLYQLVKFKVDDLKKGEKVTVKITYPSLRGVLTDNGVRYYKFNPKNLSWYSFCAKYENNTVILKLRDGGFGDDDGKANGVLEDDGGVGWAGYSGNWSASICRDEKTNEVHTYWLYVPHGNSFAIHVYDGDDGLVYNGITYHFWLDVYYPNGTLYESFNATSNEAWDNFTVNTHGQFGWWKVEIHADAWPSDNGNYYGLNVTGGDAINVRVNESWSVNGDNFYGTPDAVIIGYNNTGIPNTREFWVYAKNDIKLAIYDPDIGLNLSVYDPYGNLILTYQPTGNNTWNITNVGVDRKGWYRILLTQESNHDDYSTGGNFIKVAVNISDGLYFKPVVSINGRVLEDFYPLGKNDGEDKGIPNVRVLLYRDDNGNGVLDFQDKIREVTYTNESGYYRFEFTKGGNTYFVVVDSRTVNTTRVLNDIYTIKDVWAEETYQTNDSNYSQIIPFFGGRSPNVSDVLGVNFEHYVKVNLSSYKGESVDFGFSFDVIVNTKDSSDNLRAIGEVFVLHNVSGDWKTVYLHNYYDKPVIVCTYDLPSSSDPPAVVRINDVGHYSFDIRLQNPGDLTSPTPSDVYCIVMEEGNWTLEDGRKVEAHRVLSDGINGRYSSGDWDSTEMEQVSYNWSYTNPVVLGQVMSYNDSRWSVFWTCNGNRQNPPDSSNLYVGKHVGEDSDTTRNPEMLGVIVVESGSGTVNGIRYEAELGGDSVRGVGNSPPYNYTLNDVYTVGVATQNAMDGGNGGWAVLYGSNPIGSSINLAIDEDQINDNERRHVTEQVAYWVFNKSGVITTRIESKRFCQGCLRQFILNSNAITGKQRSYFVMMVNPNSQDLNGKWWTIIVNSSLGSLPTIKDSTELNGTVFYPNMTVRDENGGYVTYDYSTKMLKSYDTQVEIPVGVGNDKIPFSGDEPKIKAIPKPEIEIYGNGVLGSVLNVTANDTIVTRISVFGAKTNYSADYWNYGFGIKVGVADSSLGNNVLIKDVFAGLRANASDPKLSGMNRNEYAGIVVYSNNTTILDSITAFNGATGILYWGKGVNYGHVGGVVAFRNGLIRSACDGFALEGWMGGDYDSRASNITFENCLASKNAGFGVDSWFGKMGLRVVNCTIEFNGIGDENGDIKELGGIRVLANNSYLFNNLIRDNRGSGIVIGRMANYSTSNVTVRFNSIYNNSWVGIDIDPRLNYENSYCGDNVTLNDGKLNSSQPNYGVDYPIITYAELNGSELYVEGFIKKESAGTGSSNFSNAVVDIYLVKNSTGGDNLVGNNVFSNGSILSKHYGEGWIYLGSLTATNGKFNGTIDVTGKGVEYYVLITATSTLNGNTSEFGPNYLLIKRIDVLAGITAYQLNDDLSVTISVKAYRDMYNVRVYWIKPENFTVLSISGDYDSNGTYNNVYWWNFSELREGDLKQIRMNITIDGDARISDVYSIGVDPEVIK